MNEMYFSSEEIKQGLHTKFIDMLIEKSYAEQDCISYYNDIRIVPCDCGAILIQWGDCDWQHKYSNAKWVWQDDEHILMKEIINENNEIEYVVD